MKARLFFVLEVLAVLLLILFPARAPAFETTVTASVLVNTDAADFAVIANVANRTIRVTHIDVQNLGTTNKVTFQLCDGACAGATSIVGPFQLSVATATAMGGGWSSAPCADKSCYWIITPGNALNAQVDTGATNNVRITVTYYYSQF